MKKIKRFAVVALSAMVLAVTMTSCAGFNSLSEDEAYDLGYGIGRVAGYYLNN